MTSYKFSITKLSLAVEGLGHLVLVLFIYVYILLIEKNFTGNSLPWIVGVLVGGGAPLLLGVTVRFRLLRPVFQILNARSASDPDKLHQAKLSLLKHPAYESLAIIIRVPVGLGLYFLILYATGAVNTQRLFVIGCGLILLGPVGACLYYFQSESLLVTYLEDPRLTKIIIPEQQYRHISIFTKVLLTMIAVTIMPLSLLILFLSLINDHLLDLQHIGWHVTGICSYLTVTIVVITFCFAKSLRKTMNKISEALHDVASGRLSADPIPLISVDEMGAMSRDLSLLQRHTLVERKRTEESLRESEESYRVLFENLRDVFYRADHNGNIIKGSPSCERVFGYTVEEALTLNLTRDLYAYPEQRQEFLARLQEKGYVDGYELQLKRKDGTIIWTSVSSHFYKDHDGNILGVEGTLVDITARKQAESELKQHRDHLEELVEERTAELTIMNDQLRWEIVKGEQMHQALAAERNLLQLLMNTLPDYIYIKDPQSRFVLVNDAKLHHLGLHTLDDIVGKTDFDVFPPELAECFAADERALFASGQPLINQEEPNVNRETGERTWVLTTKIPFRDSQGNIAGLMGINRDITGRKQAEEDLKKAYVEVEQRVAERTAELLIVNEQLKCEIAERKRAEEELKKHRNHLEELVEERTIELTIMNAQLQREIVERRQAEETLAAERNLLRTLIDNMPDLVYVKDQRSRFVISNFALMVSVGVTKPEDLIGKTDFDFHPPDLAEKYFADEQELFISRQPVINREEVIFDHRTNGTTWLLITKIPLVDHQGNITGLVGVGRDITERKRQEAEFLATYKNLQETLEHLNQTQAQLVESEKMAAIGQLVAGVAHEINTPLGIGVTATSHLEQESQALQRLYQADALKRSDLESYVKTAVEASQMILKNLERAAEQVRSFKQIAVDQSSGEQRRFNLKSYLAELVISLQPKLRKGQHTITVHCPEDIEILSYPGAFSQIVTNLVINSVIHGFEDKPQGAIVLQIVQHNDCLQLCYGDNGKGMSPDVQAKIFDPFYTTKRGQGGSGLGLYIVFNLVRQKLHGHIDCESIPGEGTTFTIRLPSDLIG